jgi:FAD/FMN-containing dehydrogenase
MHPSTVIPTAEAAEEATELRELVLGPVLTAAEPDYPAEVAAWNLAVTVAPRLVVGATCAADVAATVGWSAERGYSVGVQASGHGIVPGLGEQSVLITTRRMKEVRIDPIARTATVAAGAYNSDILAAATSYGLAPLVGSSSNLGAVGYTLGGGLPITGRTFGFAADRVRALEIVTADGRVLAVDAEHEPELFWALRGGKGNFGVVTSMTIELEPLTTIYAGGLFFAAEHTTEVLHSYRTWIESLPDEASTSIALIRMPPLPELPEPIRGKFVVHLRMSYVGDAAQGAGLLAPMRAVAPALVDTVAEIPIAATDAVHMDPPDPMPSWERGTRLRELSAEAIDTILAVAGPAVEVPLAVVELRHLGGAFARPAASPNAISGRGEGFSMLVIAPAIPGLEEIAPGVVDSVLTAVAPYESDERLVNWLGRSHAAEQVLAAYSPETRERLLRVKTTYDPANVFRHGHAIIQT